MAAAADGEGAGADEVVVVVVLEWEGAVAACRGHRRRWGDPLRSADLPRLLAPLAVSLDHLEGHHAPRLALGLAVREGQRDRLLA